MTTELNSGLTVEPILQYPRLVAVDKSFLLTVDFKPLQFGDVWFYQDLEEIPIRCVVKPGKLFQAKCLGEPAVIIHRYGGTYGAARFLLAPEPSSLNKSGKVQITLTNRFGVPIGLVETDKITIRESVSTESLIELATGKSLPQLIEYEFETAVFKEKVTTSEIEWKTLDFETIDLIVEDGEGIEYVTFEFETAKFEEEELERETKTTEGFIEILKEGYTPDEGVLVSESQLDLEMVRIPAGTFVMGASESDDNSFDRERPQHLVKVPEFYLGRFLITQEQWREVASWEQVDRELNPEPSNSSDENYPVDQISWDEAQEFCARLSQKTGRDYRLPSEAEWEYACRAIAHFQSAVTSEEQLPKEGRSLIQEWNENYYQPYSYGDRLSPEVAIYSSDSPVAVGSFPANGFGLYDMHGNLYEWCEDDWHGSYNNAPTDGSGWLNENDESIAKVIRGGAWNINPRNCRSAYRYNYDRGYRYDLIGFRVACSLPEFP